ncbi:hypothetical protein HG530_009896 [Fusarium avenaceum]|nr:hypothetical protein HG530_009896 [Fusarium avenaceum]
MSDSGSQLAVFEGTGQQRHEGSYRHVIVSLLLEAVHSSAAGHDAGAVRSLLENGRRSIDQSLRGYRTGFVLEAVRNHLETVHNHPETVHNHPETVHNHLGTVHILLGTGRLGIGHILLGLHTDYGFEIVHGCLVSNRNLLGLRTGWSFETGYSLAGCS